MNQTGMVRKLKDCFWDMREAMARPALRRWGPLGVALAAAMTAWILSPEEHRAIVVGLTLVVSYGAARMLWENFLNLRPLNLMFRYFAVQDILDSWKRFFPQPPRILEVGSGPQGLGHLIPYPFWGCDVKFPSRINPNLQPVTCSGASLPFGDDSFDVVISMDTIEHVPTDGDRRKALEEMKRVAKKAVIVGYPAGAKAQAADEELAAYYCRINREIPEWLSEHVANGMPPDDLVETQWGKRFPMLLIPNESMRFHRLMMRLEAHTILFYVSVGMVFLFRPVLRILAPLVSRTPDPYRRIYVVAKDPAFVSVLNA